MCKWDCAPVCVWGRWGSPSALWCDACVNLGVHQAPCMHVHMHACASALVQSLLCSLWFGRCFEQEVGCRGSKTHFLPVWVPGPSSAGVQQRNQRYVRAPGPASFLLPGPPPRCAAHPWAPGRPGLGVHLGCRPALSPWTQWIDSCDGVALRKCVGRCVDGGHGRHRGLRLLSPSCCTGPMRQVALGAQRAGT